MMNLIDTHTHLYLPEFDEDKDEMIRRAIEAHVNKMYLPNVDSETIEPMLALEAAYPDHCFAMMGLHPCSVKENYKEELAIVEEWLWKRPFAAVGEIGIDLYWDQTFVKEQKEAFLIQCEWAKKLQLPIVIHTRNATQVAIDLVRTIKDERLYGIFHCFGGTLEEAEAIIDMGFYLGIGGVLTFKKSGLDKIMEVIDLQHIVLETDSPYLAPVPYRGKRNESAYILIIAEKLAEIKGIMVEEVARISSANAKKVFSSAKSVSAQRILQR
ncbi:MAG: TatD family hydrolase [Saprospiraceae bacterium]|nr:TatD family hydrolase [Saprospiraceae bacterium]